MTEARFRYEERQIKCKGRTYYLREKKERKKGFASEVVLTVRTQRGGKGVPIYRTVCKLEPSSVLAALERIQRRIGDFYFVIYTSCDEEVSALRREIEEMKIIKIF